MTATGSPVLEVHLDTEDGSVLAGTAFVTIRRGEVTTRFEYDDAFLVSRSSMDLSPHLRRRDRGAATSGLPGAFADAAPDRWGRNLIRRRLHALARAAGNTLPTVTEVDYLCGVSDHTRQGALRFRARGESVFRAPGVDVPRLVELPALLAATRAVTEDTDDFAAVNTLLAAGSASLGGARPKASVRDADRLAIAKFPHPGDAWDVMAWEATALDLAERCGVTTPPHRLHSVGGASVLLVDRFDRIRGRRVPYISAMTMLDRTDGQYGDYVELAETFAAHGARVRDDLRQLWRRIAFSVAINNTDDHLRNHGFLHTVGGWTLAPVFDINPNPDPTAHRVTSVVGATDRAGTLEALFAASDSFELPQAEARAIWDAIVGVVTGWRTIAVTNGIGGTEQREFAEVLDAAAHVRP